MGDVQGSIPHKWGLLAIVKKEEKRRRRYE
jgi:hypothetical protein